MSKEQAKKNIKLSLDFDEYVIRNPRVLNAVPKGASIILTSSKDKQLSESNRQIAQFSRNGRFVVAHKDNRGWKIQPLVHAR